jgi:hypothetical protein
MKGFPAILALIAPILFAMGCRDYPERLSNKTDISRASSSAKAIDIWKLPIGDYPLLRKFTNVEDILLDSEEGTFATDEKLKALSKLGFTNLLGISIFNGRLITDDGISALSGIHSLHGLALEGTAITDVSCGLMASRMHLAQLNVANCQGITLNGLKTLAASVSLQGFEFSADKLTQEQVLNLIASFKNVTSCVIVDPDSKLDIATITAKCAEKKIHVAIKKTGALQEIYGITNSAASKK